MTLLFDAEHGRLNAIREEFSAVTHARIESLRKAGLHVAETLPKKQR